MMEKKTSFNKWKKELFSRFGTKNLIKSKCKTNKQVMIFLKTNNKSNILVGKFDGVGGYGYVYDRRKNQRSENEPKIKKTWLHLLI